MKNKKLQEYAIKFIDLYVINKLLKSEFDSFIVYYEYEDEYSEPLIEYDFTDGRLYIDDTLNKLISSMFSFSVKESQIIWYAWFTTHNNVEVEFLKTPGYDEVNKSDFLN